MCRFIFIILVGMLLMGCTAFASNPCKSQVANKYASDVQSVDKRFTDADSKRTDSLSDQIDHLQTIRQEASLLEPPLDCKEAVAAQLAMISWMESEIEAYQIRGQVPQGDIAVINANLAANNKAVIYQEKLIDFLNINIK
jgi:hypothetical protein